MSGPTLGVLVAGGRGARLGAGVPKALAALGGESLLARGRRTLARACDVVVVAAPRSIAAQLGPDVVLDVVDGAGPLAGIVAGLAARPFARAAVLGVDFPCVGPALLSALLARLDDAVAVLPAPLGVAQPLVCALAPPAAGRLAAAFAAGERSATAAIEALGPLRLEGAALEALPGGAAAFLNVNTAGDLAEAARRVASGAVA